MIRSLLFFLGFLVVNAGLIVCYVIDARLSKISQGNVWLRLVTWGLYLVSAVLIAMLLLHAHFPTQLYGDDG